MMRTVDKLMPKYIIIFSVGNKKEINNVFLTFLFLQENHEQNHFWETFIIYLWQKIFDLEEWGYMGIVVWVFLCHGL